MMRTTKARRGAFHYEIAVFSDGSVAARRFGPDPLRDWTDTFDGIASASEELSIDVQALLQQSARAEHIACGFQIEQLAPGEQPVPFRPMYVGDGYPNIRRLEDAVGRYQPTEDAE